MSSIPTFWNALMPSRPSVSMKMVGGVETRVIVCGEEHRDNGAVILIHGTSGHLESFVYNISALAERYLVVAYDLPWHGLSGIPEYPYEVSDFEAHLYDLMRVLDVSTCALVGHSLGAWIAAKVALNSPDRIERLVLIGAGGAEGSNYPGPGSMKEHLIAGRTAEVVKARLEFASGSGSTVPDELLQFRLRTYQDGEWASRVQAFTYQREPDVWARNAISEEEWAEISCPILLIWGSEDRVVPVAIGRGLADWLDNGRLEVIDGCGHLPQFEDPSRVNALIAQFLAELPGATSRITR